MADGRLIRLQNERRPVFSNRGDRLLKVLHLKSDGTAILARFEDGCAAADRQCACSDVILNHPHAFLFKDMGRFQAQYAFVKTSCLCEVRYRYESESEFGDFHDFW
ncbi:hypothetical protein SDC9_185319 [bioreactor metagenome]|uniref:Uncharacterized protein n=1 Tax=bioreactor metagenome TaxID=1076179 RepID=A0A645HFJ2_9ZZZZ